MAKILLAWEYGSGFGHVAMLVPLALALRNAGHEPVLALKEAKGTRALWQNTGLAVIQAPYIRLPSTWDRNIRTDTLADVFQIGGLIDIPKLMTLGRYWQDLLAKVKPDLVVAEFSPTLSMVTRGVIPTVTIGTGFSMPPVGRNLPSIRFWDKTISDASKAHEQALLNAVQTVQQALNLTPVAFVGDLFGGDKNFVCVLPELDCYAEYRTEAAIGPLTTPLPAFRQPTNNDSPQAFFYLMGEDAKLPAILKALEASTVRCDGYIRQLNRDIAPLTADTIHLYETPQPLADILPDRALLIHHGGMGTADTALRLGVPQLVLCRHLEQKTNGASLMRAGVGHMLMAHNDNDLAKLAATCKAMAEDNALKKRAETKALHIASNMRRPAVHIVTEACCLLV